MCCEFLLNKNDVAENIYTVEATAPERENSVKRMRLWTNVKKRGDKRTRETLNIWTEKKTYVSKRYTPFWIKFASMEHWVICSVSTRLYICTYNMYIYKKLRRWQKYRLWPPLLSDLLSHIHGGCFSFCCSHGTLYSNTQHARVFRTHTREQE